MTQDSAPSGDNRRPVSLTRDESNAIVRQIGRALAPRLGEVMEEGLPGPMLQMLSMLERVERQREQEHEHEHEQDADAPPENAGEREDH